MAGRVFCSQLDVGVINLYSFIENSISCKVGSCWFDMSLLNQILQTFVSRFLRFEVHDPSDPLSLSFEENLHMLENSSIVWVNGPLQTPALTFGLSAQLVIERNVSLVMLKRLFPSRFLGGSLFNLGRLGCSDCACFSD